MRKSKVKGQRSMSAQKCGMASCYLLIDHRTREIISCDYFLDALADPEFALKIRERHPEDLDSALRMPYSLKSGRKTVIDFVRLKEETNNEENPRRQEK